MSPILMSKTSTVGNWPYFLILIGVLQIVSFTGLVFLSTFNPKMPFLFPSILEQRSLTKWQKSFYLALLEQKCHNFHLWAWNSWKCQSIHFFFVLFHNFTQCVFQATAGSSNSWQAVVTSPFPPLSLFLIWLYVASRLVRRWVGGAKREKYPIAKF